MSIKHYHFLNYIFLLFIILLSRCFSQTEEINTSWDEHTLFDYVKQKYLTPDNPEDLKKLHYLIVDPNEYLKGKNLDKIKKNLELLYKEFNVTTFIYVINAVGKNKDLGYKLKDFASFVFSEIYKYNNEFDEYLTISSIFRIEDKKMHIRLGSTCRDIIYDFEALSIIKKRGKELENNNIEKLLKEFTKELLSTYRQNYKIRKDKKGNTFLNRRIVLLIIIIIFIGIFISIYYIFCDKRSTENMSKNESIDIFNE